MNDRFNAMGARRTTRGLAATWLSLACTLALTSFGAYALPGFTPATAAPASNAANQPEGARRLIEAVRAGRADVLRQQLGSGVAIDACAPGDGTALIVAAQRADKAMVDTLLRLGADATRACAADGNPLIAAAASGDVEILARLLGAGAQVNAIVPGDETALITAVRNDRLAAVEYLAAHGADPNLGVRTDDGQWRTPLNQARSDAIARFLRGTGATQDGVHRL